MDRAKINAVIDSAEVIVKFKNPTGIAVGEESKIAYAGAVYREFMKVLGLSTNDPNHRETPFRVAKMFATEWCKGVDGKMPELTVFPNEKKYDEYIIVKDIPYNSVCSHHHVPFFGKAYIAYLPDKKLLGLSKFARIVNYFASKPQIQEGLTSELVEFIFKTLKPLALMVVIKGNHLCMSARGVKAFGSEMVTSAVKGPVDKQEVMRLFNGS